VEASTPNKSRDSSWNPKKALRKKLQLESLSEYQLWYFDKIMCPKEEEWQKHNVIDFMTKA